MKQNKSSATEQPIMNTNSRVIDACIAPNNDLEILSKREVSRILDTSKGGLYQLFRRCSLAVLNCGNQIDDIADMESQFQTFDIRLVTTERGVKLALRNAPASAFVDGDIIQGISEHLFSVLRDIIYTNDEIIGNSRFNLMTNSGLTDAIFHILRNAGILYAEQNPRLVVCWGGHSISQEEYIYSKNVGYEVGLRGLDICTGCGPGAMKGPMKGATIGHANQRNTQGQYLGITEPGIIAAEPPNPIVNQLVIMPDIEKRLEAFLRVGHAICVFPGGVGTMEEILYVLGVLMHEDNADMTIPLILTGPESSRQYFDAINQFITDTLGSETCKRYHLTIGQPAEVSRQLLQGVQDTKCYRKQIGDAYYFNWRLTIPDEFQRPFKVTHENVRQLKLHKGMSPYELAVNLRCVFSVIVSGNVKESGIAAIKENGVFEIKGDPELLSSIDQILQVFIQQGRMKLPGKAYKPCYKIIK